MQNIRILLGRRVRKLRTDMGWSQEKLGEVAELHPTYVGGIERGERNVSLDNLEKLAVAFNLSVGRLLQFEGSGETVDMRVVSDSILTEILTGISQSRLVLADISTIGLMDGRPVRNGNVLYEVGLAQAVRLPEEVVLFRSDNDDLLFDVANVRVNSYDPDCDPEAAQQAVTKAITSALDEVDLKRHITIQRYAESLDYPSWWTLVLAHTQGGLSHPVQRTMAQILGSFSQSNAIAKLLEIGALKTRYQRITAEMLEKSGDSEDAGQMMRYECTTLGSALLDYSGNEFGIHQPDVVEHLEAKLNEEGDQWLSADNNHKHADR